MSKMHYFSNKFSKIAQALGALIPSLSSAPLLSILVTWSCGIWQNCGFSN